MLYLYTLNYTHTSLRSALTSQKIVYTCGMHQMVSCNCAFNLVNFLQEKNCPYRFDYLRKTVPFICHWSLCLSHVHLFLIYQPMYTIFYSLRCIMTESSSCQRCFFNHSPKIKQLWITFLKFTTYDQIKKKNLFYSKKGKLTNFKVKITTQFIQVLTSACFTQVASQLMLHIDQNHSNLNFILLYSSGHCIFMTTVNNASLFV